MSEQTSQVEHRVWQVVREIPPGRVATYGQVAKLAGIPSHARLVGRILSHLPAATALPWHRVINAAGKITHPGAERQLDRLAAEGVIPVSGRVSLRQYQWQP